MNRLVYIAIFSLLLSAPLYAEKEAVSIHRAKGKTLTTAVGHYTRARSLLLAALREFDSGLKLANPELLLDVKEWRNSLLDRAEDLEKIIAPQPRASESGVQFRPDTRLLSEAYR